MISPNTSSGKPIKMLFSNLPSLFKALATIIIVLLLSLPANAGGFRFKIKNTTKNELTVFYKISKKSGNFKLKALVKLKPSEERIKSVSVGKAIRFHFTARTPRKK